jgi:plastocyanin
MRSVSIILALPVLALAAACGGSSDSSGTTSPTTPSAPSTPAAPTVTNAVTVSDFQFNAPNIQVSPGTTVTWTWAAGSVVHNVTFSGGDTSGDKPAGSTYQKTFTTAGTFSYVCTIHSVMQGSVLVK